MKVFVTGATGFIGSAVVRELLQHGHTVIALARNPGKVKELEELGASISIGMMEQPESYLSLVQQVDAVVHTAQAKPRGRWTSRRIAAMHRSDALMTRTLSRECLNQGKAFVYTSGALAHLNGEEWISETTPVQPCLLAKGHADMVLELNDLHQRHGLRAMMITPGFVYGAGGFIQETVELLLRRQYRVIGDGQNYWGLVHVSDLASAYRLALECGHPGDNYFVSDDMPMKRRDVIDSITTGLGLPRAGYVPGWVVGFWLGFPLVEAITASIRMRNDFVKSRLGWLPRHHNLQSQLPALLQQIRSMA